MLDQELRLRKIPVCGLIVLQYFIQVYYYYYSKPILLGKPIKFIKREYTAVKYNITRLPAGTVHYPVYTNV